MNTIRNWKSVIVRRRMKKHARLANCEGFDEEGEMRTENSRPKNEWVVENAYEFEIDQNGDLFVIKCDNNPELQVTKEKLPSNSVTKALLNELKKFKEP